MRIPRAVRAREVSIAIGFRLGLGGWWPSGRVGTRASCATTGNAPQA